MKSVLFYELLQSNKTVTAKHYSRQLNNLAEIEQKRPVTGRKKSFCCTTMPNYIVLYI